MYNQQGTQNIPGTVTSVPPLMVSKTEPEDQLNQFSKKRPLDPSSPEDSIEGDKLTEDEKTAKKQRRLLKNREAAAQFRHRQKAYMQKLEKHAEDLTTSNAQVIAKIDLLASENKLMKEQLGYLRNFMKTAVSLSFPTPPSLPPDSVVEGSPDLTKVAPIPELFAPLVDVGNTNPNQPSAVADGISIVPNAPIPATMAPPMMPPPDILSPVPSMPPPPVPTTVSLSSSTPLTNSALINSIFNSILAPDMDPSVVVKIE